MDVYEKIYQEAQRLNDKNLKDIISTYAKTYSDVANMLKKHLSYKSNPKFTKVSQYVMDRYVADRFADLVVELTKVVPKGVDTAVSTAYAEALLSKHIKDDIKNISLDQLLKETPKVLKNGTVVTQLKEVTMRDLLQATNNTEYAVKRLIRETFTKHLTIDSMLQRGHKEIAARLSSELSGKKLEQLIGTNMTGIVDKSGRKWNVDTYVNMAVRTKFHQAHVEGVKQFVEDYDGHGDLARIPTNQKTVDNCKHFEGLIISMTGKTEGYRTYAELKATNQIFHPNCRHNPKPYWNEESIPKSTMATHKRISKKSSKFL